MDIFAHAEQVEQAIRRTRMARVSAGQSRETAEADRAYAVAACLELARHQRGVVGRYAEMEAVEVAPVAGAVDPRGVERYLIDALTMLDAGKPDSARAYVVAALDDLEA